MMEEQKKPEEKEIQVKTLIDQANEAAERLEKANERHAELLKQEENLEAKKVLGGRSIGAQQFEKPKEETPQEYAKRVFSGGVNPLNVT